MTRNSWKRSVLIALVLIAVAVFVGGIVAKQAFKPAPKGDVVDVFRFWDDVGGCYTYTVAVEYDYKPVYKYGELDHMSGDREFYDVTVDDFHTVEIGDRVSKDDLHIDHSCSG
jgi:hypothetical protein